MTNIWNPLQADGGGCLQAIAFSGDGYLYMVSDTQGAYRTIRDVTTNMYGQVSVIRNRGLGVSSAYHDIASVWVPQFDPSGPVGQVVYAMTSGGILISIDRMDTWSVLTTVPKFSGNTFKIPGGISDNRQRPGRRHMAEDSSFLFVGTKNQGVMRSANHGQDNFPVKCNMNGSPPGSTYYCRSLFQDPGALTTLYAGFGDTGGGTNNGGLWKCTNAHSATPNFNQVSGLPANTNAEDVVVADGWVYVALGTDGVWVASTSNTNSWTQIGATGALDPTAWWCSLDVKNDGSGNHVLLCACSEAVKKTGDDKYRQVCQFTRRLSDGVITNTTQMSNLNALLDVGRIQIPGGTRSWWNSGTPLALGAASMFAPCIRWDPDPSHSGDIYMSATEGLYRWNSSLSKWQLCSNVMPQYLGHQVRGWSGGTLWCTSDWGVVISLAPGNEDASTLNAISPINSAESWAVSVSEDETKIYTSSTASNQKYTTIAGDVFQATPALNPTWSAMNLASAIDSATGTHEGGITAVGLCALNQSGGAKSLLAAVPGKGVWLWTSAAGWVLVDTRFCNNTGSAYMDIQHAPGSQYVYIFDRHDGIWRSNDYGTTWVRVYAVTSTDDLASKIAVDPTRPGSIWFTIGNGSIADGVYHITGAHTGIVGSGATLSGPVGAPLTTPGPIGISDTGTIYVALQDTGSGSGLKYSVDNGAHWLEGNSDGTFSFIAARPEQISFVPSHSGIKPRILVSNGNVVCYADLETAPALPTSGAFTERQASQNFTGSAGTIALWNNQATPPSGGAGTLLNSSLFAEFEISDSSSGGMLSNADTNWVMLSDAPNGTANGNARVQIWAYLNCTAGLYADASHLATFTYSNTSAIVKGKLYEETVPSGYTAVFDVAAVNGAVASVASPASLTTGSITSTYQGGLMRGMIGVVGSATFSSQTWAPTSPAAGDGSGNNATNVWNALRGTVPSSGTSLMSTVMTYSGGPMTSWAGTIVTVYAIPVSPLAFTTTSLPDGSEGTAYGPSGVGVSVVASGGTTPYTYGFDTGSDALPSGMSYGSSTGLLSGTPAIGSHGTYNLVFKVTDNLGVVAIKALTLVIQQPLSLTGGSFPTMVEGQFGYSDISGSAAGGTPPLTFSTTTTLPSGLSLSSTGVLSGTPAIGTAASAIPISITVTDSAGHTATATFFLTILAAVPETFPPPGGSTEPVTAALLDENLNLISPINFQTLTAQLFYNFVGAWSMTIPYDDVLWQSVKKFIHVDPDTGIITQNGLCTIEINWQGLFKFGGKIENVGYSYAANQQASSGPNASPGPLITLSGADYLALVGNRIAFPDPTHSWPLQTTTGSKTYTGPLETVIKSLISDNVATNAVGARKVTIMDVAADAGLGGAVTYKVKFAQGVDLALMDIIRLLVGTGGPMGIKITRNGQRLTFDTYVPIDRSATAYFSPEIGNLTSVQLALDDPTVTVALVQSGVAPNFSFVQPPAPNPETMWSRTEVYVDQTGTDVSSQAIQAGQDALDQGSSTPSLIVTATDIPLLTFGKDYFLGDIVSVEPRFGDVYTDLVSGVNLTVDPGQQPAISVVPTIGYSSDPGAIDPSFAAQILKRVRRLERRLNAQIG